MKFEFPPPRASASEAVGSGEYPLQAWGAVGDGVTDDLAAIQAAIDSGEDLYAPSGIYLVDGSIMLRAGLSLRGLGMHGGLGATTFKSADFAHALVFSGAGSTSDDIFLSNFRVDGNKAHMTPGNSAARGIQLQGARWHIHRLWGYQVLDQCFNIGGEDALVENCFVTEAGTLEHLDAGGLGGSGFTGGHPTMKMLKCHSIDNALAGFKFTATLFDSCVARRCGGGFSSGTLGQNAELGVMYNNCVSEYNATDGWYIRSQMDKLSIMGCVSRYNDNSGIVVGDDCRSVLIGGGTRIYNNGQLSGVTAGATIFDAFNGIHMQAGTVGGPVEVVIDDTLIYDTQSVKTQDVGISSTSKNQRCVIGPNCVINDHKIARLTRGGHVSNMRVKGFVGSPVNSATPLLGWTPTALGTNPFATTLNSQTITVTHTAHGRAVNDYVVITDRSIFADLPDNPLSVTNSSATVTVTHTAHGSIVGETVELRGLSAVGGITVYGRYPIVSVPDANSYTIVHSAAATSTATGGGTAGLAGYWALVGGLHVTGRFRIQTVPNANTYTFYMEALATATATGGGAGVMAMYATNVPITYTGSPNVLNRIASFIIPEDFLVAASKFKVVVTGSITGATCTKEIFLGTGSAAGTLALISDQAAAEAMPWWAEATFVCETTASVKGLIMGGEYGGTITQSSTVHAINLTINPVSVMLMARLGGLANDTITVNSMSIMADE